MTKYVAESQDVRNYKFPIINHKVEQVVRAIYWGFEPVAGDPKAASNTLSTKAQQGSAITYSAPDDWLYIGIADARGYRFSPSSNSALIALGLHPTAVLLHLTRMRLDGKPVVRVVDDALVALHSAVVQCARDAVFNWYKVELVPTEIKVKGKVRKVKQPVVVDLPILRAYHEAGKPKLFT